MVNLKMKFLRSFWFLRIKYKKFGKRSLIYKPILIMGKKYISIGDRVTIRNGARIEVIDKHNNEKFKPNLVIGNNTCIEQNLHLICGGKLSIGEECTISSNVFISDIDHEYKDNVSALKTNLIYKETKIGNYCFVGTGSILLPGTILGNNVIVGANSTVKGIFPNDCIIAGNPAKIIKVFDKDKQIWIDKKELNE